MRKSPKPARNDRDAQSELDDRAPAARAAGVASQVVSVAVEMVVPALLGRWLDTMTATAPLFLIIGTATGLVAGVWHLVTLAGRLAPNPVDPERNPDDEQRQQQQEQNERGKDHDRRRPY